MGKSKKAIDYNGERTADAMVNEALRQVKRVTTSRLKGKKKTEKKTEKKETKKKDGKEKGKPVVTLTDDNFNELVLNSNTLWIVEFYAPWCGHW